jgi:hypothetical protein
VGLKRLAARPKTVTGTNEMLNVATRQLDGTLSAFDGEERMFHVEQMTLVCVGAMPGQP